MKDDQLHLRLLWLKTTLPAFVPPIPKLMKQFPTPGLVGPRGVGFLELAPA